MVSKITMSCVLAINNLCYILFMPDVVIATPVLSDCFPTQRLACHSKAFISLAFSRSLGSRIISAVTEVDGDLLGFISPSLTLFSAADEEAVTLQADDDMVDVTMMNTEEELRIKTEPVEYTAAALTAFHTGNTAPCTITMRQNNACVCNPLTTLTVAIWVQYKASSSARSG